MSMKIKLYILAFLVFFFASFSGVLVGDNISSYFEEGSSFAFVEESPKIQPVHLLIPKLEISVDIESVGKDKDGRMGVPVDENNAGWWSYGAAPGQMGSTVLAGHVDRREGGPGIFYRLDALSINDTLEVVDLNGKRYIYRVIGKEVYPDHLFPMKKVFGRSDRSYLNLVTCVGLFDQTEQNYQDRLVVYSVLQ
jgi:sortase A